MNRTIRLADIGHIATPRHDVYSAALQTDCRAVLAARGLRYDNRTGIVRDNSGELERFSRPADHEPMPDLESVMRWQFSRYINNSASRVLRGFAP